MSVYFQQHGSYRLQVKGNVLIAELNGAWNLETAIEFKNEFKRSTAKLIESTWGHLAFLDDWETGTPEIDAVIIELVQWCWKHNLKRAAHVYSPSAFKQYYLDKVVVEKQGEFIKHAFSDKKSAIEWLASEGYEL